MFAFTQDMIQCLCTAAKAVRIFWEGICVSTRSTRFGLPGRVMLRVTWLAGGHASLMVPIISTYPSLNSKCIVIADGNLVQSDQLPEMTEWDFARPASCCLLFANPVSIHRIIYSIQRTKMIDNNHEIIINVTGGTSECSCSIPVADGHWRNSGNHC